MDFLEDILIPLGICVIMPILIVWLNMRARQNEINRKSEVMIKAIESGAQIDPDFFKQPEDKKSTKEKLLNRLTGACVTSFLGIAFLALGIFSCNRTSWDLNQSAAPLLVFAGGVLLAIGIALLIVYLTGKKMLAKEIEEEEKNILQK